LGGQPDGPLARFCPAGGTGLLLGASLSNITLLHHAEHLAAIPAKRVDHYEMPVLCDGERTWVTVEEYDTTHGIADFGEEVPFAAIGRDFLATGAGRRSPVGVATATLFPATALVRFGVHWLETHHRNPERAR